MKLLLFQKLKVLIKASGVHATLKAIEQKSGCNKMYIHCILKTFRDVGIYVHFFYSGKLLDVLTSSCFYSRL